MDISGCSTPQLLVGMGLFISQPLISEAEEENSQTQAEKPAARAIDSLVKPAVPSICSEKEIEFCFLAARLRRGKLRFMGNQRVCSLC